MLAWINAGKLDLKRKHSENETYKEKKAKQAAESQSFKFQKSWLDDFEWLRFDSQLGSKGVMHCCDLPRYKLSHSHKTKSNTFAVGTTNFQKSALTQHEKSNDHCDACNTAGRRKDKKITDI